MFSLVKQLIMNQVTVYAIKLILKHFMVTNKKIHRGVHKQYIEITT